MDYDDAGEADGARQAVHPEHAAYGSAAPGVEGGDAGSGDGEGDAMGDGGGAEPGGANPHASISTAEAAEDMPTVSLHQVTEVRDASGEEVRERFFGFLRNFPGDETADATEVADPAESDEAASPAFPYRAAIASAIDHDSSTIFVDFAHLQTFDWELAGALELELYRFDPYLRRAVTDYVLEHHPEALSAEDAQTRGFFAAFYDMPRVQRIRELRSECIGKLVAISGTVTRSSEVRPELLVGAFRCMKCGFEDTGVAQQFKYTTPMLCRNSTCNNTREWSLNRDASIFADWQRLRVQENADEIPAGSMPRSLDVILRNEVVEKAKAGDKMVFTGQLVVLPDSSAMSRMGDNATMVRRRSGEDPGGVTGLQSMGVRELTYRMAFVAQTVQSTDARSGQHNVRGDEEGELDIAATFTAEERDEILAMHNEPNLYQRMVESVAPTVFGHHEVKRGILLMLFGGVHKETKEGIKLRGDINVCIVGDPSTAKSQFLKYVHGFLPRAIYASGKASSAAGLTASVMKDPETGEFCVEAGALMLADNGICCIDEFDQMELGDQVAIHEAMEQQTISITKSGIQATLNARASILAAANPVSGRYDRAKTLKANVAISAPIMSRFDLFFVVLDDHDDDATDERIATHILRMHQHRAAAVRPPFSESQLQRYIRFARAFNPVITDESHEVLVNCYRSLRQSDAMGRNKTAYRITVRQLESMIRLSEALARLHLDDEIRPKYVREAYRLLKKSIIHVETEDIVLEDVDDAAREAADVEVQRIAQEELREGDRPAPPSVEQDENVALPVNAAPAPLAAPAAGPPVVKPKKSKVKIAFAKYQSIANLVALHLRRREERGEEPLMWREITAWYIEQQEEAFADDAAVEAEVQLVNQVLARLVKRDAVLIYAGDVDGVEKQDRLLGVHPNYEAADS